MNERIKELAEQARKEVNEKWAKDNTIVYPEAHYRYLGEVEEKFAELIVRECMFVAVHGTDKREPSEYPGLRMVELGMVQFGRNDAEADIQEHFGVIDGKLQIY